MPDLLSVRIDHFILTHCSTTKAATCQGIVFPCLIFSRTNLNFRSFTKVNHAGVFFFFYVVFSHYFHRQISGFRSKSFVH